MIPVLGVPILTGPELLWEMLDSVDVPVGRVIVIDNGCVVPELEAFNRDIELVRPGCNLGVAASWNRIMHMAPAAPWWMMVGYDLTFAPGDLDRLTTHMETIGGVGMLGTFSAFALDRATLAAVGTFDENFHPAYYEDNDYDYRCRLKGVPINALPFGGKHKISSTIYSKPSYFAENQRTFVSNHYYFLSKWGGEPYQERFATPFDNGSDPASWSLIEGRVAEQTWR